MFKLFFKRRRLAEFNRGFDWAAGQLFRGATPEQLEWDVEMCFESTEFDKGVKELIRRWRKLFCSDTG